MGESPASKKIAMSKVGKVMKEYKMGKLHSGSKHGPMVKSHDQAVAIAMSETHMGKKKKSKKAY